MTFNIGQQNAGIINIAGRDQRIDGGQQGTIAAGESEWRAVRELRSALAAANLDETRAAGSLTTASVALIGPLQTLAGWLGDLGAPILHMLPG